MNYLSIMICLSGSEASEQAARLAWSLAPDLSCYVAAEHVIDSAGPTWLLTRFNGGFLAREDVGHGYSSLCDSLSTIAEVLKQKYDSVFSPLNLAGSCNIDFGDPVSKLSRKAAFHDLVFVGGQPSGLHPDVLFGLARTCPVPLVVVKSKPQALSRLAVLAPADHLCARYLRSCSALAGLLKLEVEIIGLGASEELKAFRVLLEKAESDWRCSLRHIEPGKDARVVLTTSSDTIVVVPVRSEDEKRITIFGEEIGSFLSHLDLPLLVIWPEEHDSLGNRFGLTGHAVTGSVS